MGYRQHQPRRAGSVRGPRAYGDRLSPAAVRCQGSGRRLDRGCSQTGLSTRRRLPAVHGPGLDLERDRQPHNERMKIMVIHGRRQALPAILVLLALGSAGCVAASAQANSGGCSQGMKLTTSATGTASGPPDLLTIDLTVATDGSDAQA